MNPLDRQLDAVAARLQAPTPSAKPEALPWWLSRHEQLRREARARATRGEPVDLILLGDSITHGWDDVGHSVWDAYFAPRRALALGCWGDCTEHLLWRLQHGALDGLAPRVAVLMIGTNNSGDRQDEAALTAAGIRALLRELRVRLPSTRVLLLAVFPREREPQAPLRRLNDEINALIAGLADGEAIRFLNINSALLQPDGRLSEEVMPDQLHLSEFGYRLWAEAMAPTLDRLLAAPLL